MKISELLWKFQAIIVKFIGSVAAYMWLCLIAGEYYNPNNDDRYLILIDVNNPASTAWWVWTVILILSLITTYILTKFPSHLYHGRE